MSDPYKKYYQGSSILEVRRDWCKGCDICVDACPKNILELDQTGHILVTDISQCIFCGICAERCPDFCFSIRRGDNQDNLKIKHDETPPGK